MLFDRELADTFPYRRKRGGHLFSKHRFLSAQMEAYLADDLWRDLAARAFENAGLTPEDAATTARPGASPCSASTRSGWTTAPRWPTTNGVPCSGSEILMPPPATTTTWET